MKLFICAKILGPYLPSKKVKIGDCVIEKHPHVNFLDSQDKMEIPLKDELFFFHNIEHKVNNFIQYPQKPISSRYFQSEYSIRTEVETHNVNRALEIAIERFDFLTANLSLTIKTKIRKVGNRKIRREDEQYDYEITGAFIKSKGQFIRIKLPRPSLNGHNYFPAPIPKGFIAKTKEFMKNNDQVFYKALMYLQEATKMKDTGNYNSLLRILSLIKCIELISKSMNIPLRKWNSKKTKKTAVSTKDLFEMAGNKIGVTKKSIKYAQQAWDARNNDDIAHANESKKFAFINHSTLDGVASEYLIKYKKYLKENPPAVIIFGGRKGWKMMN